MFILLEELEEHIKQRQAEIDFQFSDSGYEDAQVIGALLKRLEAQESENVIR